MIEKDGGGLRHNEGKTRYDLVPAFAQEQYARVLTKGAEKYAPRNWERGMPWSKVLASLERHLYAIKHGEDHDVESGLLHSAHVMCNAAFLTEYYKIFPQGDDRVPGYYTQKRIGMDIDDVLASFLPAYCRRFDIEVPINWMFDADFRRKYESLEDHFFENLASIVHPADMEFEPVVYITNRRDDLLEATQTWLFENNNYPVAPVIITKDKVAAAKRFELDVFVDDKFDNFLKLNQAGILCYLFDAPHNQKYNVGHKRITRETINRLA